MTNFLKEKKKTYKTYKFFYSLRELQTADKRVLKKTPPNQIAYTTYAIKVKIAHLPNGNIFTLGSCPKVSCLILL